MKKIRFSGIRQLLKGKGFVVALVLSISAVGISTYIAYNGAIDKISDAGDIAPPELGEDVAAENPQENIPIDENDGGDEYDFVLERIEEEVEEANNFVPPREPRVMPVDGEVINPFSNGELVKSSTLGVWRTHDGVDIAAALGSDVMAMSGGIVTEVFNDPLWGICVVIDHGDGVISTSMGLDKTVKVAAGQEISAGEVIGTVGGTAEAETAEPPHLHFALKKNGEWVDPIAYINE